MISFIIWTWMATVGFAILMGGTASRLWVLPGPRQSGPEMEAVYRKIRLVEGFGFFLLIAGTVLELPARTLDMSGRPMYDLFKVLPIVLGRTHYGIVWKLGEVSAVVLLALWLAGRRGRGERFRALQVSSLVLLLVIAASRSASGHAADAGDFSLLESADWLHLLAASVWGGGIIVLSMGILPGLIRFEGDSLNLHRTAEIATRFSRMAGFGAGLIIITAAYNGYYEVRHWSLLLGAGYGETVLAKMVLLGFLIALGGYNRYMSVPLLQRLAGIAPEKTGVIYTRIVKPFLSFLEPRLDRETAPSRFKKMVKIEAFIFIAIFLLASMLRHEIPAIHAHHMGKPGPGPGMPGMTMPGVDR